MKFVIVCLPFYTSSSSSSPSLVVFLVRPMKDINVCYYLPSFVFLLHLTLPVLFMTIGFLLLRCSLWSRDATGASSDTHDFLPHGPFPALISPDRLHTTHWQLDCTAPPPSPAGLSWDDEHDMNVCHFG